MASENRQGGPEEKPLLPRTANGLIAECRWLLRALKASSISVESDYHCGLAIRHVEKAICELEDLKYREDERR